MGDLSKAQQVVELTNGKNLINHVINSSTGEIKKTLLIGGNPSDVARVVKVIQQVFASHQDTMLSILAGVMVSSYSDEELDALVEFYSTPIGRSIGKKQETVDLYNMRELSDYTRIVVYPVLRDSINKVLDEIEEEIRQEEAKKAL